jgi:polyisoprenoid-binding protein YceI
MFKSITLVLAAGLLAFDAPSRPVSAAGSWQVDIRHSDAQLITDATTDYGKTKIDTTLGFARVRGTVKLDANDPANSTVDISVFPATSMAPVINEDGKFLSEWLSNLSNHTLICFHSKGIEKTADGRLKTTGTLVLTRVDRNVEAQPTEGYAGPVYGPPQIHRVTHEATLFLDIPAPGSKDEKDGAILASGSTRVVREDFPQLLRAVVSTYWPLVFQDENCQAQANAGEGYHGSHCTGMLLQAAALPEPPHASNAEDIGSQSNFNAIVGNHVNIVVHLRLLPKTS